MNEIRLGWSKTEDDALSHIMYAYWLDEKSETGHEEQPIAELGYNGFYAKAHEIYDLIGASKYNAGPSGNGEGCKISKRKILAALDHYCERRLQGEEVFRELEFLSQILAFWQEGARSIYFEFR